MIPKLALRRVMVVSWGLVVAACGARSQLDEPGDGGGEDVTLRDTGRDAAEEPDVVEEDVIPPIDAIVPDVPILTDCPDAGATLVYVVASNNELFSFYPPTLTFTKIGTIACPSPSSPFSMAVDRAGTAYTEFSNGTLFEVSTANAGCKSTSYMANQLGWTNFGMGYASIADGGEDLFVIEVDFHTPSKGLGTIDTSSFTLSEVGPFSPALTPECELTGTGDGRLFALCLPATGSGSTLAQIDPTNANIIGEDQLTTGGPQEALAFAFWGGDFWIFTSPSTTTTVTKFDPVAKTETVETMLNAQIVGAGVSTCAPQ